MKALLSITALLFALTFSVAATANSRESHSYMEKAISRLPHDKAEAFHAVMRQAHEQNKDLYDQMHGLHQDLHNILTADTFDRDAFVAKSNEIRELHDKAAANLDAAFASAVAQLSQKERKTVALAMTKEHKAEKAQKAAEKAQ